jgi:hypothetical protein
MTTEELKGTISVMMLFSLIFLFAIPQELFKAIQFALPYLPPIGYAICALPIRKFLWKVIDKNANRAEYERLQSASLTLTGFCFTSLSLLISFFKDEIKGGKPEPREIIFYFSFALIAFICSYTVLRFRIRNGIDYAADALMDSGIWFILVGMWDFFYSNRNSRIAGLFVAMMVFFGLCIARNLYLYISTCSNK